MEDEYFEIWSLLAFSVYDGNSCQGGDCKLGFGLISDPKAGSVAFVKRKVEKKKRYVVVAKRLGHYLFARVF